MPKILEHVDKIARDKQRGVLFVVFGKSKKESILDYFSYDYKKDSIRKRFLSWLKQNAILYQECAPLASENGFGSYRGELYNDIPREKNDERYLNLNNHLEYPDGKMKIEGIEYYYLPLEAAMKNAHHDVPGFWEKWAEDF